MKKLILKNVAILTIALFGFAAIGVNVVSVSYGKPYETIMEDPGEGGGAGIICGKCTGKCWKKAPSWYFMDCWFSGSMNDECDNTATPPDNCK